MAMHKIFSIYCLAYIIHLCMYVDVMNRYINIAVEVHKQ